MLNYIWAGLVTIMILVVVGGILIFMLSAYVETKRIKTQAKTELRKAEYEAHAERPTACQRLVLAKNYVPEMEIIYTLALTRGETPEYLTLLNQFREDYPEAYALWIRVLGPDSDLEMHVQSAKDAFDI